MSVALAPPRLVAGDVSSYTPAALMRLPDTGLLVRDVVRRMWPLFAGRFPGFDEDDAFGEAMVAMTKAAPKYRPATARWSTYLNGVVSKHLLFVRRTLTRRAALEARAADRLIEQDAAAKVVEWVDLTAATERADGLAGGMGDDDTVEDWAGRVYAQAVATFPTHYHLRGNKRYTAPQALVAVLVMRRLSMGCRRAAGYFADNPDLLATLGMTVTPSYVWFHRAVQLVTRKMKIPVSVEELDGGKQ